MISRFCQTSGRLQREQSSWGSFKRSCREPLTVAGVDAGRAESVSGGCSRALEQRHSSMERAKRRKRSLRGSNKQNLPLRLCQRLRRSFSRRVSGVSPEVSRWEEPTTHVLLQHPSIKTAGGRISGTQTGGPRSGAALHGGKTMEPQIASWFVTPKSPRRTPTTALSATSSREVMIYGSLTLQTSSAGSPTKPRCSTD